MPQINIKNTPDATLVIRDSDKRKTFTVGILESSTIAMAINGNNPTNMSGEVIELILTDSSPEVESVKAIIKPVMQKIISTKILAKDKKYFLIIKTKVLDGRIFITGKVDTPEEKLQITKLAWETKGARSVRNDIKIKEKFDFKKSAKDILITSQLRTALIVNKNIKATNYQIDTYKKKIYVYGIALTDEEKEMVISEAKEILDVEDVVASILLLEDLRIQKN